MGDSAMGLFLKIIGGFVVSIILLLVLGWFFVKWKFGKILTTFVEQLAALGGSTVPPFRMNLRAIDASDEADEDAGKDAFVELCEDVEDLDFDLVGTFAEDEMMLKIKLFVQRQPDTWIVVYQHSTGRVWADVYRCYADETAWTFCTVGNPGLAMHPGQTTEWFADGAIADVVRAFQSKAPTENIASVADEKFARHIEAKYAVCMNWQIQRGGPTVEEIRTMAEYEQVEDVTDEMVDKVRDAWTTAISRFLSEMAVKQYSKEQNLSKEEVFRQEDRVVAIHDRMSPAALVESIYGWSPDDDDDDDFDDDDDPESRRINEALVKATGLIESGVSGKEVFRRVLEDSGREQKFELLGQVAKPIKADIWLRPEDDEDEFDDEDEDMMDEVDDFTIDD